jgi:hypothetical protein
MAAAVKTVFNNSSLAREGVAIPLMTTVWYT